MQLLVDTPVWSLLVRRRAGSRRDVEEAALRHLREAARTNQAVLLGPVRQEVLSGIATVEQFREVRDALRPFGDLPMLIADYESAAENFNLCKSRGVQATHVDVLLCAVARRLDVPVLTLDNDFTHYRTVLGVTVLDPRD